VPDCKGPDNHTDTEKLEDLPFLIHALSESAMLCARAMCMVVSTAQIVVQHVFPFGRQLLPHELHLLAGCWLVLLQEYAS